MEKSFIFNSINGDRRMKAEDFREIFIPFFDNGVFPNPASKLQVIENNGMNVIIKEGKAFMQGAIYINTGDLVLTLDHADGVLNRIDRIVLRMDTLERNITCKVKKGAYASSPVPPTLQRDPDAFEICLAEILVSKGVIDIKQSMITDTRLNTQVCGIVTGLVKEIDTSTLYNQLQAAIVEKGLNMDTWIQEAKDYFSHWLESAQTEFSNDFNSWFDGIKGALDGDIAGNLLNRIIELENVVNNLKLESGNVMRPNGKNVEESISANETSISLLEKDKANKNHKHDDVYYTESEIDTKFNNLSISNPNILINGSFQVWQRGNNFLSGNGYTADRWKRYDYTPGIKILKNNKGMNLQSTGASQSILITQCLDGEFLGSLWGKDITLSLDYKTYSGNPEIIAEIRYDKPLNNLGGGVERETINVKSKSGIKEAIISCTMKNLKYDKQTLVVCFTISNKEDTSNFSTIIKGVKLEIGNKATPIGEHNYTDELIKCKRYYDKCMLSQSACISDPGQLFVDVFTTVYDKRVIQPTVKFIGDCYAKESSGTPIKLLDKDIFKYFGGLEIQNGSISPGRVYTFNNDKNSSNNVSAPAWIEIDAEIY